jgi:hypothetical protein
MGTFNKLETAAGVTQRIVDSCCWKSAAPNGCCLSAALQHRPAAHLFGEFEAKLLAVPRHRVDTHPDAIAARRFPLSVDSRIAVPLLGHEEIAWVWVLSA